VQLMRIRPYIEDSDYAYLSKWTGDERAHALWSANFIPYPMTKETLRRTLDKGARDWGDSAYTATEDDGTPVGFFCYCIDVKSNTGFLKYIIVDRKKRGKGYGQEMLRLVLEYAFMVTGARAVQLNVFSANAGAKYCYEKVGFVLREITENAFSYRGERWDKCNMIAENKAD
jgi:RimJ/RimL family protein N-acetyltransferase